MTNPILATGICLLTSVAYAQTTTVPFSEIITTSPQEGMTFAHDAFSGSDKNSQVGLRFFQRIIREAKCGTSNAFLVKGVRARYALAATSAVLTGRRSADMVVNGNSTNTLDANYWLVVYLGESGSTPTRWVVESVVIDGNKIIMNYEKSQADYATIDEHRYYYWVPLGELKRGANQVVLFDTGLNETTLMRRVEVN